jgi:hypothetical protein
MASPIKIEKLVPGGILPSDRLHVGTYDETCSRCRKPIPEEQVPLLLWTNHGNDLFSFCCDCLGVESGPSPEEEGLFDAYTVH